MVLNTGFTVSDILENDFYTIVGIISSNKDEDEKPKDKVVPLSEFVKSIKK